MKAATCNMNPGFESRAFTLLNENVPRVIGTKLGVWVTKNDETFMPIATNPNVSASASLSALNSPGH